MAASALAIKNQTDDDMQEWCDGDAGASQTVTANASQIKVSDFIVMGKGRRACKVIEVKTSKPGKHGHAKCRFTATCIFTGSKYEDVHKAAHLVDVPVVSRKEYMLWSRDSDGYLALMNPITGSVRQDLRLPGFPATIETDFVAASKAAAQQDKILYVTVIAAMGQEAISAGFKIVD